MKLKLTFVIAILSFLFLCSSSTLVAQSPIRVTTSTSANDNTHCYFSGKLLFFIEAIKRTKIFQVEATPQNFSEVLSEYRFYRVLRDGSHKLHTSKTLKKGKYIIEYNFVAPLSFGANSQNYEVDIKIKGSYYYKFKLMKFSFRNVAIFSECGEVIEDDPYEQPNDYIQTTGSIELSNKHKTYFSVINSPIRQSVSFNNVNPDIPVSLYLVSLQSGETEILFQNEYFTDGIQSISLEEKYLKNGIYKIIFQQGNIMEQRSILSIK